MQNKKWVKEYGATTACTLRLCELYKGTGRTIYGDSWFGSIKCAVALLTIHGLRSILIVKTNSKHYPKDLLDEEKLQPGQWKSVVGIELGQEMMCTKVVDLKTKYLVSTCSTTLPGEPRLRKHGTPRSRPQVSSQYSKSSPAVDVHNHYRTGSNALEDSWKTLNYIIREFSGVLSFVFTNAFLGFSKICKMTSDVYLTDVLGYSCPSYISGEHNKFNLALADQLMKYAVQRHSKAVAGTSGSLHELCKHPKSVSTKGNDVQILPRCFLCYHSKPRRKHRSTFYCP